jgi:hypothetical protein
MLCTMIGPDVTSFMFKYTWWDLYGGLLSFLGDTRAYYINFAQSAIACLAGQAAELPCTEGLARSFRITWIY